MDEDDIQERIHFLSQESLEHVARQTVVIELLLEDQTHRLRSSLEDLESIDSTVHVASRRLSSIRNSCKSAASSSASSFAASAAAANAAAAAANRAESRDATGIISATEDGGRQKGRDVPENDAAKEGQHLI